MIPELAQAIRNLAMTGRLSPDDEENLSAILDEPKPENDEKSTPKSTPKSGGK